MQHFRKTKCPVFRPGIMRENRSCDQAATRLPAELRPVRLSVTISKETFWPSFSVRRPARSTAEMWTKMSLLPLSG